MSHALETPVRDWHQLPRRMFLGGAGAMFTLPFLEAMMPIRARAATADPVRLITIFWPNGMYLPDWVPAQTGTNFTLPFVMKPLEAAATNVRSKINILSGMTNLAGIPDQGIGTGDHGSGTGAAFTCTEVARAQGSGVRNGVSLDQQAAAYTKQFTRIASLQLGLEESQTSGNCDYGYGCVYTTHISWQNPTTPLAKTIDPKIAFDRLFQGYSPNATQTQQQNTQSKRASVLDYVHQEITRLSPRLSAADRAKLDQYFTGVRELESEMQSVPGMGTMCSPGDSSQFSVARTDVPKLSSLMNSVMTLAFQCDATRVISHMLGNGYPSRSYPFIGVSENHHELSHYDSNTLGTTTNPGPYRRINQWLMQQVADLLKKLDSVPEAGGTMLDNSIVIVTSDCADASSHSHDDMPLLLAGKGRGAWRTGQHLDYSGRPVADLFLTVLRTMGVQAATFGKDGRSPLALPL